MIGNFSADWEQRWTWCRHKLKYIRLTVVLRVTHTKKIIICVQLHKSCRLHFVIISQTAIRLFDGLIRCGTQKEGVQCTFHNCSCKTIYYKLLHRLQRFHLVKHLQYMHEPCTKSQKYTNYSASTSGLLSVNMYVPWDSVTCMLVGALHLMLISQSLMDRERVFVWIKFLRDLLFFPLRVSPNHLDDLLTFSLTSLWSISIYFTDWEDFFFL